MTDHRSIPHENVRARILAGRHVKVRPLAEEIGVSPNALYEAIKRGEVAIVEIGSAKRIPPHEGRRLLGLDQNQAA